MFGTHMRTRDIDIGMVLAKAQGPGAPRSLRILIGSPLIGQAMTQYVPDAASCGR